MQLHILLFILLLVAGAWAQGNPQLACPAPDFPNLTFSRDGSRLLLFGESSSEYFVWDVRRLSLVASQKLDYTILSAELSPDGKLLALGERPRRLAVLEIPSKQRVFLYQGPAVAKGQDTGGYGVSWSPKQDMLAFWGIGFMREAGEPKIYLYRWPAKKLLHTFPGERQGQQGGWSEQSQFTVRDFDGLRLYDPSSGKLLKTLPQNNPPGQNTPVKELHRLGQLASGCYYDEAKGRTVFFASRLSLDQTGRVPGQGDTRLFDGQEKTPLGAIPTVLAYQLSPNGKVLALLLQGGVLLLDVEASLAQKRLVPLAAGG